MNATLLQKKFEQMGARAKVRTGSTRGHVFDVGTDKRGEFFDISLDRSSDQQIDVLDVRPKERHLLLMVSEQIGRPGTPADKEKVLCGHDERHWFVAGVPVESSNVHSAIENLKPKDVQEKQSRKGGKRKKRNKRNNDTFKRQGEWFFTPADISPDNDDILRNEPLSRGAGKDHIMEYARRSGGRSVWVLNGRILTAAKYKALSRKEQQNPWRYMVEGAAVYAKGTIRHPDHNTITLQGWHLVQMNTEQGRGGGTIAFLD